MDRFNFTYGKLDLSRYPGARRTAIQTADGKTVVGYFLPESNRWMEYYTDKNNALHAQLNISLDDATALNTWAQKQDEAAGKKHTNFHALAHIRPTVKGLRE